VRKTRLQRRSVRSFVTFLSILILLLPSCSSGSKNSKTDDPNAPTPLRIVDVNGAGGKHLSGTVYLDPGHGGVDHGTSGYTIDGTTVDEKTVVLQIALLTAQRLRADGLTVVMTRASDNDPCVKTSDLTTDGSLLTPSGVLDDLQCRIDKANTSKANVFLSLHMNAFSDPSVSGTETFYDDVRPFAAQNKQLAQLVQQNVIKALHAEGFSTPDRGAAVDSEDDAESMGTLPNSYNHLVVLGPAVPGQLIPTQMPGALCEIFFLSNPSEATAATQSNVQALIASALTNAIEAFITSGG
jgi:N-acetylmuramoyl-L-alanine amidase